MSSSPSSASNCLDNSPFRWLRNSNTFHTKQIRAAKAELPTRLCCQEGRKGAQQSPGPSLRRGAIMRDEDMRCGIGRNAQRRQVSTIPNPRSRASSPQPFGLAVPVRSASNGSQTKTIWTWLHTHSHSVPTGGLASSVSKMQPSVRGWAGPWNAHQLAEVAAFSTSSYSAEPAHRLSLPFDTGSPTR